MGTESKQTNNREKSWEWKLWNTPDSCRTKQQKRMRWWYLLVAIFSATMIGCIFSDAAKTGYVGACFLAYVAFVVGVFWWIWTSTDSEEREKNVQSRICKAVMEWKQQIDYAKPSVTPEQLNAEVLKLKDRLKDIGLNIE